MKKLIAFLLLLPGLLFSQTTSIYKYTDTTRLNQITADLIFPTGRTLTINSGGSLTVNGTLTLPATAIRGAATLTFPTATGTLATLAGNEALSNKTYAGSTLTLTGLSTASYSVVTGALAAFTSASGGLYTSYAGTIGVVTSVSDNIGTFAPLYLKGSTMQLWTGGSASFSIDASKNGTLGGNLTVSGTGTSAFSGTISAGSSNPVIQAISPTLNNTAKLYLSDSTNVGQFMVSGGVGFLDFPTSLTIRDSNAANATRLAITSTAFTVAGNLTVSGTGTHTFAGPLAVAVTGSNFLGNGNVLNLQYSSDGGTNLLNWKNSSGTVLWSIGGGVDTRQDEMAFRRGSTTVWYLDNANNGRLTGNLTVNGTGTSVVVGPMTIGGANSSYFVPDAASSSTDARWGFRILNNTTKAGLRLVSNQANYFSIDSYLFDAAGNAVTIKDIALQPNGGGIFLGTDPGGSEKLRVGGSLRIQGVVLSNSSDTLTVANNISTGNITATGNLTVSNGTAANPSVNWSSSSTTGFYRSGAGTIGFSSNGVAQMYFTGGGVLLGAEAISQSLAMPTTGAVTLTAGGTNQNVNLTPSGTGSVSTAAGFTAGGIIATTLAGGEVIRSTGVSTSSRALRIANTSGDVYLGVESSVAGSFFTGSAAYESVLLSSGQPLFISTTNIRTGATMTITKSDGNPQHYLINNTAGGKSWNINSYTDGHLHFSHTGAVDALILQHTTGNLVVANQMSLTAGAGTIGVGATATATSGITISNAGLAGTTQRGIYAAPLATSTATGFAIAVHAQMGTANSSFTATQLAHFWASNMVKGAASTVTSQYGLYVEALSGAGTNYAIYTNSGLVRFGDNVSTTGTMTIGSTGTPITGIRSSTVTLDTGAFANGATLDFTVTVTGAAVGDAVFIGLPSTVAGGVSGMGFVSSANTVTIRLQNSSGGVIDLPSLTFRAAVASF